MFVIKSSIGKSCGPINRRHALPPTVAEFLLHLLCIITVIAGVLLDLGPSSVHAHLISAATDSASPGGSFSTYVCDNEANITAQPDRTCYVTVTRPMLTHPLLFRSQARPDRLKCLDCDLGTLRSASGLRFSMAAHTVDLSGSQVEHIEPDAIAGTIWTLLLSYNALTTLDGVKVFAQTGQLRTLHLDRNELFYLDERALDGLPELTELWLNHNRIVALVARMFQHLPRLQKLRLHSNRLRTLDGDLLAGTPLLRELTLNDNQLLQVHDDVWAIIHRIGGFDIANVQMQLDLNAAEARRLEEVAEQSGDGREERTQAEHLTPCRIASWRRLPAIPEHLLYNASCDNRLTVPDAAGCTYLNLRHNEIKVLELTAFGEANSSFRSPLLGIDLTHNQIEEVHPNTFDTCTVLQDLYLAHNFIRYLAPRLFARLTNLLVLELHHNQLHTIAAQQFSNTFHLQRLTLHSNRIKSIGEKAFDQLQQLDHFDMSDNRVQTEVLIFLNAGHVRVDRSNIAYLFIGGRVRRLDASRNRLRSLNLLHAHMLRHLNVSDNHIDAVSLQALTALNTIDMSGNRLTSIDFGGNAKLRAVWLADNFLTAVRFKSTALLQTLDLSGNRLRTVELFTGDMFNLHRLNVSRNQLASLHTLISLYTLRHLDASHNPIGTIAVATFQNMDSLQTLRLHDVGLERLEPGVFGQLRALRELDLSGNNLTDPQVAPAFDGLLELERVSLSDNRLERVDRDGVLRSLPKLRRIGVSGNRWRCDELGEFVRGMKAAYVEVDEEWENVQGASMHGIRCAVGEWEGENGDEVGGLGGLRVEEGNTTVIEEMLENGAPKTTVSRLCTTIALLMICICGVYFE